MIRRSHPLRVGLLALGLIAVLVLLGFTKDIPFLNEPHEIRAAFHDGSGLRPGSPVRIAGVNVGEVSEVEHPRPGARTVVATLALDDSAPAVHEGARAAIRPRIFLEGNFFVDLEPGYPTAPVLDEGEVIPSAQTSNPVQVGEVLSMLKRYTREELATALSALAEAQEAGAGRAFSASLDAQADAYRYTAIVMEALQGRQAGDLGRFIRSQGTVAAALDANPPRLRALIDTFSVTAAALASRADELRAAIADLAPTLAVGLRTFDELNAAFPAVRRLAAVALPAIRSSRPTVAALIPLAEELRRLVAPGALQELAEDLAGVAPDATRLAQVSVPALEETRLVASCTYDVLVPHGNNNVPDPNFESTGPVYEEFAQTLPALAGESRTFDANGQWFRVLGTGGLETFDLGNGLFGSAAQPIVGVNPPADRSRPPLQPDVPCETQEPPNLHTRQQGPPERIANDHRSPAALRRAAKAQAVATAVLQARLRAAGDRRRIRTQPITAAELRRVARRLGRLDQLTALTKRSAALSAPTEDGR